MASGSSLLLQTVSDQPIPNYDHPQKNGFAIVIVSVILGALATAALVLRILSRFRIQRNVGIDDWVFLSAMPWTFAYAIICCLQTKVFKFDRHIWDIPVGDSPTHSKLGFTGCICYVFSTCLIKISVLCFYRRLTDRSISAGFIYTVWGLMALEISQLVVCLGTLCFGCRPVEAFWMKHTPSWAATHTYSCIPTGPALYIFGIMSVTQDLITTAMPFTLFLGMRVPIRQKLAMGATFACGLIVCAVGAYRTYTIHYSVYQTKDFSWYAYRWLTASVAEVLLATCVASAPALKYYIRHTIDNRSSPRTSITRLNRFSDGTTAYTSTSTHSTDTYVDGEDGELGFFDALSKPSDKNKARAALTDLSKWQDEMQGWQKERTPSSQELELMREGIITPGGTFEYFDKEQRRMIVKDDPRPVIYPWADKGPEDMIGYFPVEARATVERSL